MQRRQQRHGQSEATTDQRQLLRSMLQQQAPRKDASSTSPNAAALHAKARFKEKRASASVSKSFSSSMESTAAVPLQSSKSSMPVPPKASSIQSSLPNQDREFHKFSETLGKELLAPHSQLLKAFSDVLMDKNVQLDTKILIKADPFKFDAETKEHIAKLHQRAKKQKVPTVPDTQVINDKKWLRQRKKSSQRTARRSLSKETEISEATRSNVSSTTVSSASLTQISTMDSVMQLRSRSPSSSVKDVILKGVSDPILQARSEESSESNTTIPEPRPLNRVPQLKINTVNLESRRKLMSILSESSAGSASMGKEVTLEEWPKLKNVPHKPESVISTGSSGTPSFAKVKLRQTNNRPDLNIRTTESAEYNGDRDTTTTTRTDEESIPEPPPSKEDPSHSVDSSPTKESDTKLMPPPVQRQAMIPDTDNQKIDEAIVFRLKDGLKMIVGRKMLMLAESEQEAATVLWKVTRDDVDALNLDTANLEVTLLMKENPSDLTKSLSFRAWKDWIRFVNVYYDMDEAPMEDKPTENEDAETVDSNPFVALSKEEQTVIEKYRQLRQTQAPQEALDAAIPSNPQDENANHPDPEIEIAASKYRKMLKLNIPEAAVRHAMKKDGVNDRIVNAVFDKPKDVEIASLPSSPISTMSSTLALSEKDVQIAASYSKMLRAKIPLETIKSQMFYDQIDSKIISHVLDEAQSEISAASNSNLSSEDQEKVSVYKKMLSMGVPPPAVEHKMRKDGVGQEIFGAVLGTHTKAPKPENESLVPATKEVFTEEEQSIASQYRKMMKAGLPKDVLAQRMKKEGIRQEVIKSVVGVVAITVQNSKKDEKTNNSSKLLPLHWTPLSGTDLDDSSIWTSARHSASVDTEPEGSDINKLINVFQKPKTTAVGHKRSIATKSSDKGKVGLLDIGRAQNVSISLKAFKEFTYPELADIIRFLDPQEKLKGEKVQFVKDLLPTVPETKLVKSYIGTPDRLVPAEIWFQHVVDIKRIDEKVSAMRFMEVFDSDVESLVSNFLILYEVCNQVMDSEKLKDVLSMVLRIGNIMNEGTKSGGAAGFKFESLLRLTQTKSADGKTTVLDFLVNLFADKGKSATLDILSDFPDCQAASRLLVSDLISNVKEISNSISLCEKELNMLRKEENPSPQKADAGDARAGLLSAIQARGTGEDAVAVSKFKMRDRFLEAVKEKQEKASCSSSIDREGNVSLRENNRRGAISRLESFIEDAKIKLLELEAKKEHAVQACKDLARYCAESGGIQSAISVLGVLFEFASNLDNGLRQYEQRKKLNFKKNHTSESDQKPRSTTATKNNNIANSDSNDNGKSLVVLVNEMLREAPDRMKEDFKKGRSVPDPSKRLKAIYEKELRLKQFGSPQIPRQTVDIVTAIQQHPMDTSIAIHDEEIARSRFRSSENTAPSSPNPIVDENRNTPKGITAGNQDTSEQVIKAVPETPPPEPIVAVEKRASTSKPEAALRVLHTASGKTPSEPDQPAFDLSGSKNRLIRKSVGTILSPSPTNIMSPGSERKRRLSAPLPNDDHLYSPPRRLPSTHGEKKTLVELAQSRRELRRNAAQRPDSELEPPSAATSISIFSPSNENDFPEKTRKKQLQSPDVAGRPSLGQLAREKRMNRRKTMQ